MIYVVGSRGLVVFGFLGCFGPDENRNLAICWVLSLRSIRFYYYKFKANLNPMQKNSFRGKYMYRRETAGETAECGIAEGAVNRFDGRNESEPGAKKALVTDLWESSGKNSET